jgi:hypothetical protein
MLSWKEHTTEFLQELIRHEGLTSATCYTCHGTFNPVFSSTDPVQHDPPAGLIRCKDCHGGFIECVPCAIKRHKDLPLHSLQVRPAAGISWK